MNTYGLRTFGKQKYKLKSLIISPPRFWLIFSSFFSFNQFPYFIINYGKIKNSIFTVIQVLQHLFIYLFIVFCPFRAAPVAYRGSQARGLIGSVAASLCQSHSNARSKPHLQPTPQLIATPDPEPGEQGQGSNPHPHGYKSGS